MSVKFDVKDLAAQLGRLEAHPDRRKVVIVLPLAPGKHEVARAFLEEGPPFDPGTIGLASHEVFVTENEAIFVFGTARDVHPLEQILAEPELWEVVSSWEDIAAGPPRVADVIYDWASGSEPRPT